MGVVVPECIRTGRQFIVCNTEGLKETKEI
jgi:hypothetical protein